MKEEKSSQLEGKIRLDVPNPQAVSWASFATQHSLFQIIQLHLLVLFRGGLWSLLILHCTGEVGARQLGEHLSNLVAVLSTESRSPAICPWSSHLTLWSVSLGNHPPQGSSSFSLALGHEPHIFCLDALVKSRGYKSKQTLNKKDLLYTS